MSYEGGTKIPGTSSDSTLSSESKSEQHRNPYHPPAFIYYGELSQLVQNNPSAGSDGGAADCQHL